MIFLVLIEWAEQFLYIDLTKKKQQEEMPNLDIVFSYFYHSKSYLDSNIQ
jgi:hypothetical protein